MEGIGGLIGRGGGRDSAIADRPRDSLAVPSSLSHVKSALGTLSQTLDMLEERLGPVMDDGDPQKPAPENNGKLAKRDTLATELHTVAEACEGLTYQAHGMLKRLQL